MLQRLKQTKTPFGEGQFYIVRTVNSIYQLRETETHLVISTALNIEEMKRLLFNILTRYKSYTTFRKAISFMSEKENNTKALDRKQKEYKKVGTMYKEEVDTIIAQFLDKQGQRKILVESSVKIEDNIKRTTPQVSQTEIPPINRIRRKHKRL